MNEGIVVLMVLYECETWATYETVQKRVNVMEINCFRGTCDMKRVDQVSKRDVVKTTLKRVS